LIRAGDRKGNLMCWDVSTASSGWGVKDAHTGHITALAWQQDPAGHTSCALALSGGQDGVLKVWDGRTGSCIARQPLHVDAQGKGAIGSIVTGGLSVVADGAAAASLVVLWAVRNAAVLGVWQLGRRTVSAARRIESLRLARPSQLMAKLDSDLVALSNAL
jgi:WD40 repeat protein